MSPPRQIPLRLPHRPGLGRDDFLVADSNARAVDWIDRWPDWPLPVLAIHGPPGCGKSHLARVFAGKAAAAVAEADRLGIADPPGLLAGRRAVAVEDADRGVNETALLHLYNLAREQGAQLLITGRAPPARWPLRLADLRSRLATAPAVAIGPPDDALMAAVLVKLFGDRQVAVGEDAIAFLQRRMARSFAVAQGVVEAADRMALAERRAVTVPLLARVLADLDAG